jgi:hypothetical protein
MITQPYVNFILPDAGGNVKPISNGTIYIGKEGLDPKLGGNPIYYRDNEGTEVEISSPLYLNATGVIVDGPNSSNIINPYNKSPASMMILDRNGKQVWSELIYVSNFTTDADVKDAIHNFSSYNVFDVTIGTTVTDCDMIFYQGTYYPLDDKISGSVTSINLVSYPYTITTTSGSAQLLNNKEYIRGRVTFEAYWADTSKADNVTEINNAMARCALLTGEIHPKRGAYTVSDTVVIPPKLNFFGVKGEAYRANGTTFKWVHDDVTKPVVRVASDAQWQNEIRAIEGACVSVQDGGRAKAFHQIEGAHYTLDGCVGAGDKTGQYEPVAVALYGKGAYSFGLRNHYAHGAAIGMYGEDLDITSATFDACFFQNCTIGAALTSPNGMSLAGCSFEGNMKYRLLIGNSEGNVGFVAGMTGSGLYLFGSAGATNGIIVKKDITPYLADVDTINNGILTDSGIKLDWTPGTATCGGVFVSGSVIDGDIEFDKGSSLFVKNWLTVGSTFEKETLHDALSNIENGVIVPAFNGLGIDEKINATGRGLVYETHRFASANAGSISFGQIKVLSSASTVELSGCINVNLDFADSLGAMNIEAPDTVKFKISRPRDNTNRGTAYLYSKGYAGDASLWTVQDLDGNVILTGEDNVLKSADIFTNKPYRLVFNSSYFGIAGRVSYFTSTFSTTITKEFQKV